MRHFAITGIVTACWISLIFSGSDMRATPPSRRMSAGTRSSAITAQAPASSAIRACSGVTTSMITPPLSISASPVLTRNVARSVIAAYYVHDIRDRTRRAWTPPLLQLVGADAVFVGVFIARVETVCQRLHERHQGGVRASERRA